MPVKSDCQVKPAYLSRFEPVNSNLPKMSFYNTGCHLKILLCLVGDCQVWTWKMYRLTEPGKKRQVGSFYRYRLILHLLGYRFLFSSVERLLRAGFMYQLGLAFPTFLICDWKKERKILETWYFFLKLCWPSVRKKNVLVIEEKLLKFKQRVKNLQKFSDH